NPRIAVGRALASALLYALKLSVLSALAVVPVLLLSPLLLEAFAGGGRLVSFGVPLALNALAFGLLGTGLLVVTRDRQFGNLVRALRRRRIAKG
ncbi:MAG: murein biosynthesis integral membrane protein MurJ, partial [Treponema sp.]|nr:murein biosynthesis integral membrane protein MurJ [Treponema sp.]